MATLTEDCCFNDARDVCIGPQCTCGCHKQSRQTRREWESIKIADFERLERALRSARRLLDDIRLHPDVPPPYLRVAHEIDAIDKALDKAMGLPR